MIIQQSKAYTSSQVVHFVDLKKEISTGVSAVLSSFTRAAQAKELSKSPYNYGMFSIIAHKHPVIAEQTAYGYAYGMEQPLVDYSHGVNDVRYTMTGEAVTPESTAWFNQISDRVQTEKFTLYESEKAKGTSAADILDKIISFMDQQPEKYLQLVNWQQLSGR
ncbi:MAG: hypothetical protein Q9M31_04700 [Mariprofundus sp.]|nr:hypothetical protein [Mariprofundus sp.]